MGDFGYGPTMFGSIMGVVVVAYIVITIVLGILVFVWLHNISLNTYRSYLELKEIKELLKKNKGE